MVKNIITIFFILMLIISCVGPEEPLDGITKNTPIVVSVSDAFTFSLRAVNYSTEENYNLLFPTQNTINFTTVLLVTDFAGSASDTSYFDIFNSNDSLLNRYILNSNINVAPVDSLEISAIPSKIIFKADDFSGFVQLVLAVGD